MAATHGDLFREIGELVVAAHAGKTIIDLTQTSQEMALRYAEIGVSAETIARAIARSVGAVGISLAIVRPVERPPAARAFEESPTGGFADGAADDAAEGETSIGHGGKSAAGLFPSGLRIAVLS